MKWLWAILLFLGMGLNAYSQNFVWNKTYGDSITDQLMSIVPSRLNKNRIFVVCHTQTDSANQKAKLTTPDSTFVADTNATNWLLVLDTAGKVVKARQFGYYPMLITVVEDDSGNIYFAAKHYFSSSFNDTTFQVTAEGGVIYQSTGLEKHIVVFTKLDADLKFLIQKVNTNIALFPSEIYFIDSSIHFRGYSFYNNSIFKTEVSYWCSINTQLDSVTFHRAIGINYINSIRKVKNGLEFFGGGLITGNIDSAIDYWQIDSFNNGLFIIRFDSFNPQKRTIQYLTDTSIDIKSIARIEYLSNNRFVILASISDSFKYKDVIIKNGSKQNWVPIFLLFENDSLLRYSLIAGDTSLDYSGFVDFSVNTGPFIYGGGRIGGNIKVFNKIIPQSEGLNYFFKIDTLGNVLWLFRTGDLSTLSPKGIVLDSANASYFGTTFQKKIKINNTVYTAVDSSRDFLISKIYDFSITRGTVSAGPYCAGDTLLIPYTKDGTFADTNTFMAELSDEQGNFTGGHRSLGIIKTNKDSTIKGVLPLFNVVSSKDYRIRIISTAPQVQSYYRYDSLRLLIYSRDTAFIGNDTTVCRGSQPILKTTGGTKWQWSPGSLFADSTARIVQFSKGIVNPNNIRVIIADSSGCGDTDTAYITIKPFDKIAIQNKDTTVCLNSFIKAKIKGGDSTKRIYQWIDTANNTILSNTDSLRVDWQQVKTILLLVKDICLLDIDSQYIKLSVLDSVKINAAKDSQICSGLPYNLNPKMTGGNGIYTYTWQGLNTQNSAMYLVNNKTDNQIFLKVSSICPMQSDTATFTYQFFDKWTAPNKLKDTLLCKGESIKTTPKPISGSFKTKPTWFVNGQVYATTDTFSIMANADILVSYTATNECDEVIKDTFNLTIRPPLKLIGATDTTLCQNTINQITYNVSGGLNPQIFIYNQSGTFMDSSVNRSFQKTIDLNGISALQVIAKHACSPLFDTLKTIIKRYDSLKATINLSPICYQDSVFLAPTITGGLPNVKHSFQWFLNGVEISQDSILDLKNLSYQQHKLQWVSKDNCSYPYQDTLTLAPNPKVKIKVTDPSQCFSGNYFKLFNNSQYLANDTPQFTWQLPTAFAIDNQSSQLVFGKLNEIGRFDVKLVSVNKNGCTDSGTVTIETLPSDKAVIEYIKRKNINNQSSEWEFKALGKNLKNFVWHIEGQAYINSDRVNHTFTDTGFKVITVTYTNQYGCPDTTTINAYILHNFTLFVQNSFSPNGDNINDFFEIVGKQYIKNISTQIFNRWGEMVFKSEDVNQQWTPKDNNLNNYIYIIHATDIFDVEHLLMGGIIVLK